MATRVFPLFVPITALDKFSAPLGRIGGALEGFGKKAEKAGKRLTVGLTAPLVALGALAAKTGVDYDRALNNAAAVTGATTEQIEALGATAEKTLGAAGIPTHLRETAVAATELARGGRALADVQAMLPGTVALATAALVDEKTAARATTDVLDAWRLASEDGARVTDLLAFSANRGEQELDGLAQGLAAAGPAALETGQGLESTAAILNTLADATFTGTAGASVFGKAIKALQRPSGDTAKTLRRLGVTPSELFRGDGRLRDLSEVLEVMTAHGATAKDSIGLFGKSWAATAALLGAGTAKTAAFREELRGAGGAAFNLAKVQLGGSVGDLKRFQEQWDKFLVSVARSGLLEGLGKVAEFLGRVLELFTALPTSTQRTVVAIGAVTAALGPLLIGVGSLVGAVGKIAAAGGLFGAGALGTAGIVGVGVLAAGKIISDAWDLWNAVRGTRSEAFGGGVDRPAMDAGAFAVGAARVGAATPAAAAPAGAAVGGRIEVSFGNTPAGTRIRARQSGDVPIDVDAGYVLAAGLAG